jgi:hypothetical protein
MHRSSSTIKMYKQSPRPFFWHAKIHMYSEEIHFIKCIISGTTHVDLHSVTSKVDNCYIYKRQDSSLGDKVYRKATHTNVFEITPSQRVSTQGCPPQHTHPKSSLTRSLQADLDTFHTTTNTTQNKSSMLWTHLSKSDHCKTIKQ